MRGEGRHRWATAGRPRPPRKPHPPPPAPFQSHLPITLTRHWRCRLSPSPGRGRLTTTPSCWTPGGGTLARQYLWGRGGMGGGGVREAGGWRVGWWAGPGPAGRGRCALHRRACLCLGTKASVGWSSQHMVHFMPGPCTGGRGFGRNGVGAACCVSCCRVPCHQPLLRDWASRGLARCSTLPNAPLKTLQSPANPYTPRPAGSIQRHRPRRRLAVRTRHRGCAPCRPATQAAGCRPSTAAASQGAAVCGGSGASRACGTGGGGWAAAQTTGHARAPIARVPRRPSPRSRPIE